jgi:hypothetical protein
MKLDRNINANGRGKYALLKLRKLDDWLHSGATAEVPKPIAEAIELLEKEGILDWGNTIDSEFMVIRLKDKYAADALSRYAVVASVDDPEYASEIAEMAHRSGPNHPNCKKPD